LVGREVLIQGNATALHEWKITLAPLKPSRSMRSLGRTDLLADESAGAFRSKVFISGSRTSKGNPFCMSQVFELLSIKYNKD
jgi:hypothetical protein